MSATVVFTVQRMPGGKYKMACGTLSNGATTGEKAIAGGIAEWLETLCEEGPSENVDPAAETAPARPSSFRRFVDSSTP